MKSNAAQRTKHHWEISAIYILTVGNKLKLATLPSAVDLNNLRFFPVLAKINSKPYVLSVGKVKKKEERKGRARQREEKKIKEKEKNKCGARRESFVACSTTEWATQSGGRTT